MATTNNDFIVKNGLTIRGGISSVNGVTPTNGQMLVATGGKLVVATATTNNVAEGTNLYFTNARASAAAPVQSINGLQGAITLNTGNIPESGNLYFTSGRAAAAAPVQSVFGRTGTVVLSSSDISTALGYIPASSTGGTIGGDMTVTGSLILGNSYTMMSSVAVTSNTPTTIDSIGTAFAKTAKYLLQVTDDVSGDMQSQESLVILGGNNIQITSYAILTSNGELGVFSADVVSNSLVLSFTANTATNKTIRVIRTAISQ